MRFLSDNNEFGEVKPTPVLKSNPQGELAFLCYALRQL